MLELSTSSAPCKLKQRSKTCTKNIHWKIYNYFYIKTQNNLLKPVFFYVQHLLEIPYKQNI